MSWQVLLGVVTWWADEGLRDVGRQRFQAARGRRLTGDRSRVDFVVFHQAAFVAQRSPWRLAQVTLTDQPSSAPAVAAWADTATAVLTDEPVAQHVVGPNESWGDLGCRRMLDPKPLTAIVTPPWEASFVIDGSRLENDREFVVPELTSLGADHYQAVYDRELHLLTSWTAYLEDRPMQKDHAQASHSRRPRGPHQVTPAANADTYRVTVLQRHFHRFVYSGGQLRLHWLAKRSSGAYCRVARRT